MSEPTRSPSASATVVQLIVWSIIVGVIFSALGITPFNIVERLGLLARRISELGFDAVHWALQYLALGAIVVVPIWFIMQVLRRRGDGSR